MAAVINEITGIFVQNGIRPGYRNIIGMPVPGSSYFYFRNDTRPIEKNDNIQAIEAEDNVLRVRPVREVLYVQVNNNNNNNLPVPKLDFSTLSAVKKKKPTITSEQVYRDYAKEVRYNPSHSEDLLLLSTLSVENERQLIPPDFPEVDEIRCCHCVIC